MNSPSRFNRDRSGSESNHSSSLRQRRRFGTDDEADVGIAKVEEQPDTRKKLTLLIPQDLIKEFKMYVLSVDATASDVAAFIFREYLDEHGQRG